jgi:hypothetical protein
MKITLVSILFASLLLTSGSRPSIIEELAWEVGSA